MRLNLKGRNAMIYFSDNELVELVSADVPYLDNTTFGLQISGNGKVRFYPKKDRIVVSGMEECVRIARIFGLEVESCINDGVCVEAREKILEIVGKRAEIFKITKTLQSLLEYASATATYTREMLDLARSVQPNIALLGTRKNMPFAKKLLLKALIYGGGIPHRLGLSDSILIFKEHIKACENFVESFKNLKNTFKEHRIIMEVESQEEALLGAKLGVDVLQCERFAPNELQMLVQGLRVDFPYLRFSATGGITKENVREFAQSGVDMVVSTSMYRAKICDIKVEFA